MTGSERFVYKIKKLELMNGEDFLVDPLTIIVGPNNSGKSRFLRDIKDRICGTDSLAVLVKSIEHTWPRSFHDLQEGYNVHPVSDLNGHNTVSTLSVDLVGSHTPSCMKGDHAAEVRARGALRRRSGR